MTRAPQIVIKPFDPPPTNHSPPPPPFPRKYLPCTAVACIGVDLDHHVDLLARKGADVRELDRLVARVGADTPKVIVRD